MDLARILYQHGLEAPDPVVDNEMHYVPLIGQNNGKSGGYKINQDGGRAFNFKTAESWPVYPGKTTPEAIKRMREAEVAYAEERARLHEKAGSVAVEFWNNAYPAYPEHPYAAKKRIGVRGLRQNRGDLLIPLRDIKGRLWNLQRISPSGYKMLLGDARKRGLSFTFNPQSRPETIFFAEGWATSATVAEATRMMTVMCIDAGNLVYVVSAYRERHPTAYIIIAGDDDTKLPLLGLANVGRIKAEQAAQVGNGVCVFPQTEKDWNDVAVKHGISAVTEALLTTWWQDKPSLSLQSYG
jgi:putative DNA primase/helicase